MAATLLCHTFCMDFCRSVCLCTCVHVSERVYLYIYIYLVWHEGRGRGKKEHRRMNERTERMPNQVFASITGPAAAAADTQL